MKLLTHGLLYSVAVLCASNLGLQGLGFLYRIGLSHLAGAEGLGVYQLVHSVYAVIHAACLSGLTMACSRLSAELSAAGQGGAVGRSGPAGRAGVCAAGVRLCGVFVLGHGWISGHILGDARTAAVFPVMLACLALTGVENIVKSLCIGLNHVEWAASAELTEQVVRIVAVLTLLTLYGGQDYGRIALLIFVGMSLSECVSAALLARIYRKQIRIPKRARQPLPRGFSRTFAGIVLPVTGAAVLNSLLGSASSVILPQRLMQAGLTRTQALSELGIISGMAMPLLVLPIALISSVCTVIMPEISRSRARGDQVRIDALTRKAIGLTGLLAIPLTALIVPLAPTLVAAVFRAAARADLCGAARGFHCLAYYHMVTSALLGGMGAQWSSVGHFGRKRMRPTGSGVGLAAKPGTRRTGLYFGADFGRSARGMRQYSCGCAAQPRGPGLPRLFAIPLLCGATVFLWVRCVIPFSWVWSAFSGWAWSVRHSAPCCCVWGCCGCLGCVWAITSPYDRSTECFVGIVLRGAP